MFFRMKRFISSVYQTLSGGFKWGASMRVTGFRGPIRRYREVIFLQKVVRENTEDHQIAEAGLKMRECFEGPHPLGPEQTFRT